jgi:hypothetical protein
MPLVEAVMVRMAKVVPARQYGEFQRLVAFGTEEWIRAGVDRLRQPRSDVRLPPYPGRLCHVDRQPGDRRRQVREYRGGVLEVR